MTAPDLDALAALLDKGSVNIHDVWTLVDAVEPLLAYVRELERDNADLRHDIGRAQAANAELATAERTAAFAMRERCARACVCCRDLGGSTHWDIAGAGAVCHDECAITQLRDARRTAALAMRERCAEICSKAARERTSDPTSWATAADCAAAVRALEV